MYLPRWTASSLLRPRFDRPQTCDAINLLPTSLGNTIHEATNNVIGLRGFSSTRAQSSVRMKKFSTEVRHKIHFRGDAQWKKKGVRGSQWHSRLWTMIAYLSPFSPVSRFSFFAFLPFDYRSFTFPLLCFPHLSPLGYAEK